jgi:putative Mn2+ efflux pump MntP
MGRRSIQRGVVALYVSLYSGLLNRELPFRENLSEGSLLFVEYFLSTTFGDVRYQAWSRVRQDDNKR